MNKQELIDAVKALDRFNSSESKYREHGYNDCMSDVLDLIEKLDEPKKVKIPNFVADWITENPEALEHNGSFNWWYLSSICGGELADLDVKFGLWFNSREHSDENRKLFLKATLYGYEVEKEPRWVVKVNNMYFTDWGEDGTCPTFLINDHPNTIERAEYFDSILEAENVAEMFGGSVEIVH